VQATLLSIAIALILALVAALVGPHFVDWNKYRAEFETQASRMTGLQIRVGGPIDARLLPTPSLNLSRIDITRGDEAGTLRARRLSIEFSLGSLARGEFKATDVILEGAEIAIALDRSGRLEWPAPSVGFDPEAISIERLDVRDSRILMADAASGYGVVLDKFEFTGELRSLAGPVKGQGSFYADGLHYPYRIGLSRVGDERLRVRLNIDPIDRPLTADAEGFLSVENGKPRFAGSMTLARPLTRAPPGSTAEVLEPWRLTGKIDGNSSRAVIEQIEFQYGPDERPIRLRGDALVNFGGSPRITGVLSSPQVDLDRILALPEPQRRRPLAAIKAFADTFAGTQRLPIPLSLGVSIESLTLAGATLQRFSADVASGMDGWDIQQLELRAPGISHLAMAGHLGVADGISYAGGLRLASKDPRKLIAWLTDRPEGEVNAASSLSLDGDFRLGSDEVAVERLKASLDRMSVEGRLAYTWANDDRPARIEAAVTSPDIDLDRAHGLLQGLFDGTLFDMPREGLLSARIERATFAGVEARRADIGMRFDANGLNIERLALGDFGGVSLAASGDIDTRAQAPRGTIKLDLDARRVDGLAVLLERFSPQIAAELRRNAGRIAPAKLSAALTVGPGATVAESNGRFRIDGSAGPFRVALRGDANASSSDLTIANLARLRAARLDLGGEIETKDSAALIGFLGLDRFIVVGKGDGRASVTARGRFDGEMIVDGRLAADGLDAAGLGRMRLTGSRGASADIAVKLARANIRSPRAGETIPAALSARVTLAEGAAVGLNDLSGTVAGTEINGRLTIGLAEAFSVGGELRLGALHMPSAVAAVVGLPAVSGGAWPTEPFERGLIGTVEGSVKLRVGRVALSPQLGITNMRGVLQFGQDTLALEEIDGSIAGGRVAGSITFERGEDGLSLDSHARFAGVSLAELLPGDGALTGRATIELDLQGTGRSPVALIGSLKGDGTFTVQDGQIMRADPAAFAAVIRSVDDGLAIDAIKVGERTEAALGNGALAVALAQGEIMVAAGQLRIANTAIRAKGAELAATLGLDLSGGAIDARLVLSGEPGSGTLEGVRPEIALALRGPFDAPKRLLDVAAFTSWLALRAIEEKDKRIDALQSGRELPVPPAQPLKPAPMVAPAPDKPQPQQPPKASPQRSPAAKAAPLPTDIRPPAAARPQAPGKQAQPQPRPTSRSWLENLLGP
jgi:large subunit ribosomal protein L24